MAQPTLPRRLVLMLVAVCSAALVAAGCGSSSDDDGTSADAASDASPVIVYSGRSEEFVGPLFDQFTDDTGIELEVRYGKSAEMSATLQVEGESTETDVFYSQDAGAIGVLGDLMGVLDDDLIANVDPRYRSESGRWTGITGRARTIVYNTEDGTNLPSSIYDLTDDAYKGIVGVAPGNASFQAHVSAMRLTDGDDKVRDWLDGLVANDVQTYEKNGQIVEAASRGEVTYGLVNHYYIYELFIENPDAPVANHFLPPGDAGTFANVSAAGILTTSDNPNAERLIEFMLNEGQEYFTTVADEPEYPVVAGVTGELPAELPPLEEITGPDVTLDQLGEALPDTVVMLEESGLLTG